MLLRWDDFKCSSAAAAFACSLLKRISLVFEIAEQLSKSVDRPPLLSLCKSALPMDIWTLPLVVRLLLVRGRSLAKK